MIAFDKLGNYKREAIYFNKSGFCYNKTDKKKKYYDSLLHRSSKF